MATASERRRRQASPTSQMNRGPLKDLALRRAARRRRWRWLLGPLVVTAALVWLAPPIVGHSPMLSWIVNSALGDLKGKVKARSASLGWFSSLEVSGVEVCDEEDRQVLEIAKINGDRSLAGLLWNHNDLGAIRLEEPKLNLVIRKDGSNLQDVLAAYLVPTDVPWDAVELDFEIVNGTVSVRDAQTRETWQVERFQLGFRKRAGQTALSEFRASGTVADEGGPGRFSVELGKDRSRSDEPPSIGETPERRADPNSDVAGSGGLVIETEALPLEVFGSLLDRLAAGTRLAGRLTSTVRCQLPGGEAPGQTVIEGKAAAEGLTLASPFLGADQPELRGLYAAGSVSWQAGRVNFDRLVVESDVGNASFQGTLDLGADSAGDVLGWLPEQACEVNGQVDLARLAKAIPDTLRIRDGIEVTSGQLGVAFAGRRGPEGMSWQGRIEAGNLTAVDRGRELVWHQPIVVTLAAHEGPQGPIVENLQCDSDFLRLFGSGSPDRLTASADFDLNRLADRLGGLVDLGGVRLEGRGGARFDWQRSDGQRFEADGKVQIEGFQLARPDRRPWIEDRLSLSLSAEGRTDFTVDTQINAATLELETGSEGLYARLTQPVIDIREGGVWSVEVRSRGELARWLPRIEPWLALDRWDAAGAYDLLAETTGSATGVHVRRARLAVSQLDVRGPGWTVREPQVELAVAGGWDGKRRRLELSSAALTGTSVSAEATNVAVALPPEGPPELEGMLAYQASLERLYQWTADGDKPLDWHLQGSISGSAKIRHTAGVTAATAETTIDDLIATHRSGRQFHEARIRLAGSGSYDGKREMVELDQAELVSGTLGFRTAGTIALARDRPGLQLAGQVDYDMEKISELVRSYQGSGIYFAGRGSSPVSYQGPLDLKAAQARTGASWQWAEVYGFRVDPGSIQASLSGGMLQFEPMDLGVSEGRVRLAPQVRLAPEPKELYVEPGRIVEQVRINPLMCAAALQYVAPVLAGVATAEGRFSIELDGARIPLSDPTRGEFAGRMIVHSVRVGPGPLVRELAVLLGRASAAELAGESVVSFRMVDGRVYHRDLELVFPDLTIRTYGSVGLDQSLALVAEMPIPPKWVASYRLLDSAVRNQTIQVPIGGTLGKPRIDRNALERLSRQFLENAARNVLGDELNRGLDRLLGPSQ